MDNEMIERCCIELAQQREQNGAQPYAAYGKHAKEGLREDVIAVINAMREPTENLIKFDTKDGNLFDWNCNCHYCGGHKFAVQSYIDAIIGDK